MSIVKEEHKATLRKWREELQAKRGNRASLRRSTTVNDVCLSEGRKCGVPLCRCARRSQAAHGNRTAAFCRTAGGGNVRGAFYLPVGSKNAG